MAGKAMDLTDQNFAEAIGSGVTLVDFWAPWCGPCMMQGPIVEQVAEQVEGKATVAKLNVDEGQQSAGRYGVRSIPTLIVFKDGEQTQQFVGVQSEPQLVAAIERALGG
jgi:thioredoxin 1